MYEHNQLEIPPSFMALFSRHGRPIQTRPVIEARYEACEALAQQVSAFCSANQFKNDLSETEVLRRCHAGLLELPETVPEEARWVVCRVAEMLEWDVNGFLAAQDSAD